MAKLTIRVYPDPFLRQKMEPVTTIDDTTAQIIADMAETMYDEPGVGLAATQVGINQRIIVVDTTDPDNPEQRRFQALINPEILEQEGTQLSENEGCLSVPEFRADVKRYARVKVKALDGDGKTLDIDADGFMAIVLQHEIDHLDGILFIDRISSLKRELYKRRVRKQLKRA